MTVVAPEPTPTTTATSTPLSPRGRLPHFPALDGLRGVAVAAVLFFHGGFPWMTGGFLGVSTFFTLSGFLITSLLLAERGATAGLDLRAFWVRRFRRLMPAALAALVLATVFCALAGDAIQKRNMAGDTIASLAYVANWRFIFSNQAYADLFGGESPVLHFWSLAIEEQFYLLFPVLAWVVLQYYRKSRQWFGGILATLVVVSFACTMLLGLSRDAIYYGTETRASELLLGGVLAVIVYHRRVTTRLAHDARVRNGVAALGTIALLVCAVLWVVLDLRTSFLYQGGFTAYALLSSAVIVACIIPTGPVRVLLAVAPLRLLGRVSYGVYLYHWPLFLWLSEERTGLGLYPLFALRLAVTFAVAALSYRFLEMPVRRGQRLLNLPPARLAPAAAAAITVAVIAITVSAPKPVIDFDSAAAELQVTDDASPPPPTDPARHEPPFPRIAVFGDSTALMTAVGLHDWAAESKQATYVDGAAWLGCGIGRGGERRSGKDQGPVPEQCNHWERTWAQKIKNSQPNIAVVQIGPWEVADRKLAGDSVWRAPGDPVYDQYLLKEMVLAVDTLSAEGADVLWLTSPPVGAGKGKDAQMIRGQAADPARMARLNELINQLPAARPGRVHVVDLAGWLTSTGEDERLRPDGVHFGPDESKEAATRWLGGALVDTFKQDWAARQELEARIGASGAGGTAPGTTVLTGPGRGTVPGNGGATTSTAYTGPKRKVLVLGDRAAEALADGLKTWGAKTGSLDVTSVIEPKCGLIPTEARLNKGTLETTPPECSNMVFSWLQATVAVKPDIVVIVPSAWDLTDLRMPGDTELRHLGDAAVDQALWKQYTSIAASLRKVTTVGMWLSYPPVTVGQADQPPPATPYPASDPARVRRLGSLVHDLDGGTPYSVEVDFADYAARTAGGGGAPTLLGDGVTVSTEALPAVSEWLGNELLVSFDEFQANGNKR